jgi:hypothetical protein
MTFTTLTCNGVERTLADWLIAGARREVSNQAGDNMAFDMMLATDAVDPFPYGSQITVRIGRATAAVNPTNPTLPPSGSTSFSGGQVWFVGWRVETFRSGSAQMEKLGFKFAGPWEFFFERLVFQKLWSTWNGTAQVADWRSQVILGQSVNALIGPNDTVAGSSATNLMSIAQQIKEIAAYVINQTAATYGTPQLQFDPLTAAIDGTNYDLLVSPSAHCLIPDFIAGFAASGQTSASANLNTVLRAPLDAVNDITCAEAMRYMLRWIGAIGSPVVWFDYTTSPPTLNVGTRDQLPSKTLPFVGNTADVKIKRRDDLIPAAVSLKFRISSSSGVQVVNDIATTISGVDIEGLGFTGRLQTPDNFVAGNSTLIDGGTQAALQAAARTFAASMATIDMEGGQSVSATISCVGVSIGDPAGETVGNADYDFWVSLFPELADVTGLALYDAGGAPATVVDDNGGGIDLGVYQYRLVDGQIAPWMATTSGAGVTKQATVKVKFKYVEKAADGSNTVNTKNVSSHEKTAKITLTNLPGGTYGFTSAGEVVPYGLAGYIYNIEKIPQYEGSLTLQEVEITDLCPMGNNLNLSGGLAEWATMNACVQSVSYDLDKAATSLRFGPAGHLGAKDFVERLRVNRGPRWYYNIGGNLINSSGGNGALGSNIPKHGPSPGNAVVAINVTPSSIPDAQAHPYVNGVPGITFDATNNATFNYGTLGAPNAPCAHYALGASGSVSSFAHLNANGVLVLQASANGSAPQITIQLKLADIPTGFGTNSSGNYVVAIREVTDCDPSTGVKVYRQALVSEPYTTPLGNV